MLLIIALMLLLALLQAPILVNRKQWGELAAFSVLWAAALTYAILIHVDAPIPNPTEVIRAVLTWLYSLVGIEV